MNLSHSARPRIGRADVWRAVDYCLFSILVALLCVIVFMLLLGVTHGWSPNNP